MALETRRGDYLITTDPALIDSAAVHAYLTRSYWAEGIPRKTVERSLANALCFGVYHEPTAGGERRQIGLARVITDRATYAYLCDVYVLEEHRGQGLGKALMAAMHAHPDLAGIRRFSLFTKDAHGLYEQFGWKPLATPDRAMERVDREVYRRKA